MTEPELSLGERIKARRALRHLEAARAAANPDDAVKAVQAYVDQKVADALKQAKAYVDAAIKAAGD